MPKNRLTVMLKSLQLRHFLTESNFIWQLHVTGFSK